METLSRWVRAKRCGDSSACIQVAVSPVDGAVVIKSNSGLMSATAAEWKAFVQGVEEGDFRSTYT